MTDVEYASDVSGIYSDAEEAITANKGGAPTAPLKAEDNPIETIQTFESSISGIDEILVTTNFGNRDDDQDGADEDGDVVDDDDDDDDDELRQDLEEGRRISNAGLYLNALLAGPRDHQDQEHRSTSSSDFQLMDYDLNLLSAESLVGSMSDNLGDDCNPTASRQGDYDLDLDLSSLGGNDVTDVYDKPSHEASIDKQESWLGDIVGLATKRSMSLPPDDNNQEPLQQHIKAAAPSAPISKSARTTPNGDISKSRVHGNGSATEQTKIFGIDLMIVIPTCGCLILLSLIVIIVAVVMMNQSSEDKTPASDFDRFRDGISYPPTLEPSATPAQAPIVCLPDIETATFYIDGETKNCAALLKLNEQVRESLCQERADIFTACQSTCGNCATPTAGSSTEPTTIMNETDPPIGTKLPSSIDATESPTSESKESPTLAPSGLPTPVASFAATASVTCEPDLPGTVPGTSYTCVWLSFTNEPFRLAQCAEERGNARKHCPRTCQSC